MFNLRECPAISRSFKLKKNTSEVITAKCFVSFHCVWQTRHITEAHFVFHRSVLNPPYVLTFHLARCPPSGLRPRRTLRAVLWTAEEQGGVGAQQYFDLHKVLLHAYTHPWEVYSRCFVSLFSLLQNEFPSFLPLSRLTWPTLTWSWSLTWGHLPQWLCSLLGVLQHRR